MAELAHRVAAIDVGTNSARLLVADVAGGRVTEVERRSTVTRLGRGVDLTGRLSAEAIEAACAAVGEYAAIVAELGAERVEAIATSAVRDAGNGGAFVAELRERFALSARVLDGEEEARLTYLGACAARPPAEPTLVIDIGGGSTELVVGSGAAGGEAAGGGEAEGGGDGAEGGGGEGAAGAISFHASLQAGVVRHSERHIASDPPAAIELEALAADVRGLIGAALTRGTRGEEAPLSQPSAVGYPEITGTTHSGTAAGWPVAGIAVAGTPTSLAAIELELEPYDPERVHGHVLTLPSIQRMLSQLASAPLAERVQIPGLHPDRAPTIVAGVVILIEAMRAFGLERIEVSEHDILYGVALNAAAAHS